MTPVLPESQQERLTLIVSQALRYAAGNFSNLLSAPLQVDSQIHCTTDQSSHPEIAATRPGFSVALKISGDLNGEFVFFLEYGISFWLIEELLGKPLENGDLSAVARSALMESGNIFASAFLTEIEDKFNISCRLYPPQFQEEAKSAFSLPVREHSIVFHGGLFSVEMNYQADLFLVLDPGTKLDTVLFRSL